MKTIFYWKKQIIESILLSKGRTGHLTTSLDELIQFYGYRTDENLLPAFKELVTEKLLVKVTLLGREHFKLNTWERADELEAFILHEPKISFELDKKYFEDIAQRDLYITENAWPNQGFYYACTKKDDPSHWTALITSKKYKRPTKIDFGSIAVKNSRIHKMWKTVVGVWNENDKKPVWKKLAEDKNQNDFGNNRQPATAAFQIFLYLGWIEKTHQKGKQVFYQIIKPKEIDKIITGDIPICYKCGRPAIGYYCPHCNLKL